MKVLVANLGTTSLKWRLFLPCFVCGMVLQTLCALAVVDVPKEPLDSFYSSDGKWIKTSNKDCSVWSSFPREGESVTWSGGIANGKATGTGTLQWFTNGVPTTAYEGEMKDGMADGHGKSKLANGTYWEGDWKKGSLVSKIITIHYATGGGYKGEQKGGFKDGQGEETMPGGRYVGHFKRDRFDGKGEMTLSSGDKITGEWKDSKLVEGVYTTSDGQTFKVRQTDKGIERI